MDPFTQLLHLLGNPRYALIDEECEPAELPKKLNFPCLFCSRSFSSEKGMKIHLGKCKREEQPADPTPTVYPCATCEEIFHDQKKFKVFNIILLVLITDNH